MIGVRLMSRRMTPVLDGPLEVGRCRTGIPSGHRCCRLPLTPPSPPPSSGFNVSAIHGDRTQQDREWAIAEIRAGRMPLLVATDVAARGLDIKGMDRVINFDFPM